MSWPVANGGSDHVSLRQTLLYALLVGFAFYLGCKLGLALATPTDKIATFFPANAIVLAALLLTDQRRWWAYLLVMVLADIAISMEYGLLAHRVVLFSIANFLEALVAAVSLRYLLASPIKFEQISEMLRFFLVVFVSGSFAACVASAVTFFEAPELSYWSFWRAWFLSDTIGLLIVTPLIILGFQAGLSWLKSVKFNRTLEALGLALCLFIVSYYALGAEAGVTDNFPALLYAPLPFLLWAAIRFNHIGVHLAILVITIFSVGTAANGLGPFTSSSPIENVLSVQFYLIATAVPIMLLSAVLSQHRLTVQEKNNAIEEKDKRAAELVIANEEKDKRAAGLVIANKELSIAATVFESQEGMMVTDASTVIIRVNRAFTNITGYSAEDCVGNTPRLLSSGMQSKKFYATMWDSINSTGMWKGEILNRRKNGEVYPEYLYITAVKNAEGIVTNYVASRTDITSSKSASDEIERLYSIDLLTELPNRRLFLDRLKQALAISAHSGRRGALLFLDLDKFKNINDTQGHNVGDLLLQHVAKRLTACLREGDTVSRFGGDEFVVLLENLSEHAIEAATQTKDIAKKISHSLNQAYQLDAHSCFNSASIGATLFIGHELMPEELLKQADIAMYQSKVQGGNTLRFFDQMMQEAITARVDLEYELREAIEQQQFQLHYQMQVDRTGQPIGAEALIRWQHPERGMLSPQYFIPSAEDIGLILPLGQWVLDTACAQLKTWQQSPLTSDIVLAVNVSAKQLHKVDFVEQVLATVQRHGTNPARLKLELTESMLLDNINGIIAKMNALNKIGIHFALDDFGTGYSSLQYLKMLPLKQLKIDQSFVRDIATDSSDRKIVRTIITMASSLGIDVIAEGVETAEQRRFLLDSGCLQYQGYLFSKPNTIEEFEANLKKG
jgi:diguanylate cyclase (GGDEF)-like protein/PAS domain S-box-containing protein